MARICKRCDERKSMGNGISSFCARCWIEMEENNEDPSEYVNYKTGSTTPIAVKGGEARS